ncbi:unnamed protein product [Brachionus calyciflorus]|uniref:CCHC-type domain-containing protein n=1 Tax=Brachionus calyciflorus TaxID=104777 RepID=A0A814INS4_9BILA|nr:unnamed protein product [Brachionus calyciflorus]
MDDDVLNNCRMEKQKRNDELELKYSRNKYTVMIHGNNLEDFSSNIFDRLDELKRCTGITNPSMILPVIDNDTEIMSLKVTVDSYKDYLKLISKWPSNAFKTGVNIEPLPYNLTVIKCNVGKEFIISKEDKKIKQVEKMYGLSNLERMVTKDNNPTTKLKAQVKSIIDYIELLKNGVYLDITSKRHQVRPYILYSKVCRKCGNLNHLEKDCRNKACCLKCGGNQYTVSECIQKCINCKGSHACNSEMCSKVVDKTFSLNKYVLEILLGENIIKNRDEILRVPRQAAIDNKTPLDVDDKNLEKLIESCISKRISQIDFKVDSIKQANELNNQEIQNLKKDMNTVKKDINSINTKLNKNDEIQTNMNENQNETRSGIEELKALFWGLAKVTQ